MAAGWAICQLDAQSYAPIPLPNHEAHLNHSNIAYETRGGGPALLMVHGLPTSGRLWDFTLAALSRHFTCVVIDLPGFGRSPLMAEHRMDPDIYAGELEKLRRELDHRTWHIIGHDAGSTVAVHYAARFPARLDRLVLTTPPIFPQLRIPWFIRLLRSRMPGDLLAPLLTAVLWHIGFPIALRNAAGPTAEIIGAFRAPFHGREGARRFQYLTRWGDPAGVLAETESLLPQIEARTLVLHGRQDRTIPLEFAHRAAALIPRSRVEILDCSHFLPLFCPHEVSTRVLDFLKTP